MVKERILGIEVFGRAADYDTNDDHIVRTTVGEVRKRLAQYYLDAGRDDEIRIEIPAGSYVAQFRVVADPDPRLAVIPAAPAIELPARSGLRRFVRPAFVIGAGSVVLNIALVAILLSGGATSLTGSSTLQKFWDPVFASSDPVLISVGLRGLPGPGPSAQPPATMTNFAFDSLDPLMAHRVSMASLLAVAKVEHYAGERHAQSRILDAQSTSLSDLRNNSAVLIGLGNNSWTQRFVSQLRYTFQMGGPTHISAVVDKQHPERHDWIRSTDPGTQSAKDYAIVSRIVEPAVEQVVVLVAGLGPHGTEVAGDFITNPDQIKKLDPFLPGGWKNKNLQIVISTTIVNESSGPPKVEAVYVW